MPEEVKDATGKETPGSEEQKPKQDDPPKWVNDLFTRIGRVSAETKQEIATMKAEFAESLKVRQDTVKQTAEANDKYTEQVLKGDFTGAVDDYLSKRQQAERMLAERNQKQMDSVISDLEERKTPFFGEVKENVKKVAVQLVQQGYSPLDAVAFAYEKSKAAHLEGLLSQGGTFDSASLETSGGGSRREDAGEKKGKLNAEGKKAWEKNKTHFKDETDFISHMAPQVKARFVG